MTALPLPASEFKFQQGIIYFMDKSPLSNNSDECDMTIYNFNFTNAMHIEFL